ncbi:MAG: hypothetical protein PHG71_03500 [Kiritimatiellae bacterium]|nr:hypothetical protein [Kiritimatiellia bacterium]
MRFFWPVYISVAAAATAGIYAAAPLARPYLPDFLKPAAPVKTAQSASPQSPGVLLLKARTPSRPQQTESGDPSEGRALSPPQTTQSPYPQPSPAPVAPSVSEEDELPPALNGIYLASGNERPGWGMTRLRASVYALDGTHSGHVAAGTLVEFRDIKKSSKGKMVECVVILEGRRSEPVLVSSKELRLFTGSFHKLSARQMGDLQKYYALSGKVAERKNELLKIAAAKNPHFRQYEAALKNLMEHIDRAGQLARQRDAATGLVKMRLEDQLRTMKHDEVRLRAEYDAAHKRFREWKEKNPDALAKPENDPQIMRFNDEMAALRPRVPGLAY